MMNPTVTPTIWAMQCCWLAMAQKKAKTTGSSRTGLTTTVESKLSTFSYMTVSLRLFLTVGGLAGGKAVTCELSGMAGTLVASPAMPCTPFYDSVRCGSVEAALFHWTSSPENSGRCSCSPSHLCTLITHIFWIFLRIFCKLMEAFYNEHVASLRDVKHTLCKLHNQEAFYIFYWIELTSKIWKDYTVKVRLCDYGQK